MLARKASNLLDDFLKKGRSLNVSSNAGMKETMNFKNKRKIETPSQNKAIRKQKVHESTNKAYDEYAQLKESRQGSRKREPKTKRQRRIKTLKRQNNKRLEAERNSQAPQGFDRGASQKAQNDYFNLKDSRARNKAHNDYMDLKDARSSNQARTPKTQRQKDIKRLSRKNRKAREARIEKENQFDGQSANRSQKDYQNIRKERQARQAETPLTERQQRINELKGNNAERRQMEADHVQRQTDKAHGQVNRYKEQIQASRAETAETKRLAGGGARYGTGLNKEVQTTMYGEDMGRRFKANGGWSGVGRGAVQGAAMGGLAGGTVESMQGGDFWDGAKSGAMMGATGMAGLRGAKQATGAKTFFRGPNNIANTYSRQTEQYGVGVKALMMNNEMATKAKSVMNWRKKDQ